MEKDSNLLTEKYNKTNKTSNGKKEQKSQSLVAKPPDGGWGWVVVFSSLMCNMLVDGIGLVYGVLLPKFADSFQASKSKVSLVGSLMIGTYLCAGPIVSGLVNQFGCRKVTVAGSIVAASGFIIGSFSPNLDVLILTYGVIGGFGFGMIYLPSIVSVGYYFEKKRPLATGIAVCGSGIGTFVFSPVLEVLSEMYDWKNLLMIMAGIILNGAVCGMLMRPLIHRGESRNSESSSNLSADSGIKLDKKAIGDTSATPEVYNVNEAEESTEDDPYSKYGIHLRQIQPFIAVEKQSNSPSNKSFKHERRSSSLNDITKCHESHHNSYRLPPVKKHEIIYSGSLLYIPQFLSQPNMIRSNFSVLASYSEQKTFWDKCTCLPTSVSNILKEMLDFSLFLNIPFLILCIANIFAAVGFFIPFYFLVDRALIMGISNTKAAFLLSIIGITNTVGRILSGFLANLKNVNALVINNVALVIASVALALQPFCTVYPALVVFCLVFGLCCAAYVSLTSIILCDLLGLHKLSSAFGLLTLARGIAGVVGPPLAGMLYQATGNYDASFYFGGGMFFIGAVMHLTLHLPCVKRCHVKDEPEAVVKETFTEEPVESC